MILVQREQLKGQSWWSTAVLSSAADAEIIFVVKKEKGVLLRLVGSLQSTVAILVSEAG